MSDKKPSKSSSASKKSSSDTKLSTEVEVKKTGTTKKVVQKPRAYVRPVALRYLTAQEYLLRKGVNPNHIPVYVAKAQSLGYTKATASEWEELLFNGS